LAALLFFLFSSSHLISLLSLFTLIFTRLFSPSSHPLTIFLFIHSILPRASFPFFPVPRSRRAAAPQREPGGQQAHTFLARARWPRKAPPKTPPFRFHFDLRTLGGGYPFFSWQRRSYRASGPPTRKLMNLAMGSRCQRGFPSIVQDRWSWYSSQRPNGAPRGGQTSLARPGTHTRPRRAKMTPSAHLELEPAGARAAGPLVRPVVVSYRLVGFPDPKPDGGQRFIGLDVPSWAPGSRAGTLG
jgi:hypothetical protein